MSVIINENTAASVAEILLKAEAVVLRQDMPFTWSSGWKSPIYCDNRVTLSYPSYRTDVKKALVETVRAYFSDAEAVAGVATAGIPQGALIADELNLPLVYVRPKPKGHGMENLIEGKVVVGQKVVVVEDLISTGGSSLKAVEALQAAGFIVVGMVAIFTYGFENARTNFNDANVKLVCLSDYAALVKKAETLGMIKSSDLDSLAKWRENPSTWGV